MISLLLSTFLTVQVGAYSDEARAIHQCQDLRKAGFDAYFLRYDSPESGSATYKVRVGRYPNDGAARAAIAKLATKGVKDAQPAQTDLAETQTLSDDLQKLIAALPQSNPGRVENKKETARVWAYAEDYLALYLAADEEHHPGRTLTDLEIADTNPDPESELFAILDGRYGYALFWVKDQSRYELALMGDYGKATVGPIWDLIPGPERFVTIRYENGGDLYRESGYAIYRWAQDDHSYALVGKIPLKIDDGGEEPRAGLVRTRTEPTVESLDGDATHRELVIAEDSIGSNGALKVFDHADVWMWNGKTIDRVDDPAWFENIIANAPGEVPAKVPAALFGVGVERALAGNLNGAIVVFQQIESSGTGEEKARAAEARKRVESMAAESKLLADTGARELDGNASDLAADDLEKASLLDPGNAQALYDLAVARVKSGDTLGALRALRRAIDLDATEGGKLRDRAKEDPAFAPLTDDPTFHEILR